MRVTASGSEAAAAGYHPRARNDARVYRVSEIHIQKISGARHPDCGDTGHEGTLGGLRHSQGG